jgi:hypothetical protein
MSATQGTSGLRSPIKICAKQLSAKETSFRSFFDCVNFAIDFNRNLSLSAFVVDFRQTAALIELTI